MDRYLGMPVKEVITRFPETGKILEEYRIGCVTCAVGTCALKDVVGIHHLGPAEEAGLMYRLEKALFPGKDISPPVRPAGGQKEPRPAAAERKYSPPLKQLVDEHAVIKRWLALIPAATAETDIATPEGAAFMEKGIDFIRRYADRFHHAKEEDILFSFVGGSADIITAMLTEHETGRGFVRSATRCLAERDREGLARNLAAYRDLLTEHITKEDDLLYPWIDRGLTTAQVGELFARFNAVEETMDAAAIGQCIAFVEEAEKKFSNATVDR